MTSKHLNELINALPDELRNFIHDLESRADPAGDVRTIAELKENQACLLARIAELEQVMEDLKSRK